MSLDAWHRPYWDARNALDGLESQAEGILTTDATEGILSVSCHGKGIRRDFAPCRAHGFVEYVSLDPHLILNLVSITPERTMFHRSLHDDSVHFGVQLRPMEEMVPVLNTSRNNLMFFGEVSGHGRMERRLPEKSTFMAVDLTLPVSLPEDNRILDVEAPQYTFSSEGLRGRNGGSGDLLQPRRRWRTAGGNVHTRCSTRVLKGNCATAYLKAKANELLCLLEVRSARLSEREVVPSYRLSQSDRHNLERVRQYIENNPAGDLSVETLSSIAGFGANRTTALFKACYKMTVHQYVVQTRHATC